MFASNTEDSDIATHVGQPLTLKLNRSAALAPASFNSMVVVVGRLFLTIAFM
jgi:hypothetical protein